MVLKETFPKRDYRNLLITFKSFVTITQFNGGTGECRHKPLAMQLSKVIKTKDWTQVQQKDFLQCFLKDSAINLDATKSTNAEDRQFAVPPTGICLCDLIIGRTSWLSKGLQITT